MIIGNKFKNIENEKKLDLSVPKIMKSQFINVDE